MRRCFFNENVSPSTIQCLGSEFILSVETEDNRSSGTKYCVRLKVRVGKGLTTTESSLSAIFQGKELTVKSAKKDEPLEDASWLVICARGFATERQAKEYGESLRGASHLAGLCCLVGVDGRAIGDERPKVYVSPAGEESLRSLGVLQAGEKWTPDVHGLSVLPEDENLRIVSGSATGTVTHDPLEFVRSIEETSTQEVSEKVMRAITVLNLAQINESSIAKVALAISSIEELADTGGGWSESQKKIIRETSDCLVSKYGDDDDVREVGDAIQRVHHFSLRQQTKRLLMEHDLMSCWNDWDEMYKRRSTLFHGGANREEGEVAGLADDAIRFCARIVLSIADREGAALPEAAQRHFGLGGSSSD